MISFFKTFPDCFLLLRDLKSAIKNMAHYARLGDVIGSSYPLNPCNCTYQGHVYSFSSRCVIQEWEAQFKVILEITK